MTPSQAEVLRVLSDHQPLTLNTLGELLVCETGNSPSRLVDRLVAQGLVQRDTDPHDRRYVTLDLTADGTRLSRRITLVEERLYGTIDDLVAGQPVDKALGMLRARGSAPMRMHRVTPVGVTISGAPGDNDFTKQLKAVM